MLHNTTFKTLPNFIQADFTQAPGLDNVQVPITSFWKSIFTTPDIGDIAKFRALRRLAIDAHDHERERMFFKGEMRAKRGTEDKFWKLWSPNWLFSLFYDAVSNFGQSVYRPLLLWFALIPLFGWVYLSYANAAKTCADSFIKANYLAAQNALIFLASGRRTEIIDAYNCLYNINQIPAWLGVIGLSHTLLSAILLFLILLGARNMFKIK